MYSNALCLIAYVYLKRTAIMQSIKNLNLKFEYYYSPPGNNILYLFGQAFQLNATGIQPPVN